MRIFISVVSHYDHATIINMGSIKRLAKYSNIEVICRDNVPSPILQQACTDYNCHYIANTNEQGFAKNNNDNFLYAKESLDLNNNDYFMLLNPDVVIDDLNIKKLLEVLEIPKVLLSGNHKKVEEWRHQQALDVTKIRRPDLWAAYQEKGD